MFWTLKAVNPAGRLGSVRVPTCCHWLLNISTLLLFWSAAYIWAAPVTLLLAIASPVNDPPATDCVMAELVIPLCHADIEPSKLSKMKLALLPFTGKSVETVVTPAAPVLTWPVGPFATLGAAFPMFITPSVSWVVELEVPVIL